MSLNGNVKNFGADNTGNTDASTAIQSAMNADDSVYFPPGIYRLDNTVTIDRAKLIDCGIGSIATGYTDQDGQNSPIRQDEQVRFTTNNNIHMFQINQEQVWWRGGCFDFQNVTNHDKSAFHVRAGWNKELFPVRESGWGGGIERITVLGKFTELREGNTAVGTVGIDIDPEAVARDNGFMYHHVYDIQALGCDKAFRHGPYAVGVSQSMGLHQVKISAKDCRYSAYIEETANSYFRIHHLAGPIFPTQAAADATASVYTETAAGNFYARFQDFDAGQEGSYWNNSKTYNTAANGRYEFLYEDAVDRAIALGGGEHDFEQNDVQFRDAGGLRLRNATGAQISDAGASVNISGKHSGVMIWDTTNNRTLVANGNAATAGWRDYTGTIVVTPS
jgi:hypothetical protein